MSILAYGRAARTIFKALSKVVRAERGIWGRERTASLAPSGTWEVEAYLPLPVLTASVGVNQGWMGRCGREAAFCFVYPALNGAFTSQISHDNPQLPTWPGRIRAHP